MVLEKEFIGWVPTAGGRLSFSVIGNSDFPSRAITRNCANDTDRFVITFQRRRFVDSAAPLFLKRFIQKYFSQDGDFWFVFIASGSNCSTVSGESVSGYAYVFSEKEICRSSILPKLKRFQHAVYKDCRREVFESGLEGFESGVSADYLAKFRVVLARDGVVNMNYCSLPPREVKSKFQKLRYKINDEDGRERKSLLASQVYFFIKDITHTHQHHGRRVDAMIDVHYSEIKSAEWYSRTLRGLYKRVLQYKRDKDRKVNMSSLGLMAYIDSLVRIARSRLSYSEYRRLPVKFNDNLVASITASDDAKSARYELRRRLIDSVKTWLFGGLGLIVAVAGAARYVKNYSIDSDGISGGYILPILSSLESPAAPVAIILLIIFVSSMYEGSLPVTKWEWVQDIIRLVQAFSKPLAVTLLFVVSCSLFFAAFYLFHEI